MKFRHTLMLGGTLGILIALYFGMRWAGEREIQTVQEAKRVFEFAPEAITRLTVHRLDEGPTVGTRDATGGWSIVEPSTSIRAFDELWNRVATHAAELKNERSLPAEAQDLAAYGLDVPRLTVTVETAEGAKTLRFGYLEPTQTYRYARLDEGPIFLAEKNAVFELDRPLDQLRDAFVVADREADIVRFEFAWLMTESAQKRFENPPPLGEESEVITVERPAADAPWVQTTPVGSSANQEKINQIVDEIRFARGRNFIENPEALSDYGLDPASARVTLVDNKSGAPQTFFFGDVANNVEGGGIYARRSDEPGVFVMDGHIVSLFPKDTDDLRNFKLLNTAAKDIVKLEYEGRGHRYVLSRNDSGAWAVTDPALEDTDDQFVSNYLSALKVAELSAFLPGTPAEYGLEQPEVRVTAHLGGGGTSEIRLTANADEPGQFYARTDGGDVGRIPEDRIRFLLADAQAFRVRSMLRFAPARAEKMNFHFEGVDYALEKRHNRWIVTAPENRFLPIQQDAENLLKAVAELRALGAEEAPGLEPVAYGLDAPRFTFTVTLAPPAPGGAPEVLGPLSVGGVVPGVDQQRFAQTSARAGLFRIPQRFIESVSAAVSGIRPVSGASGGGPEEGTGAGQ